MRRSRGSRVVIPVVVFTAAVLTVWQTIQAQRPGRPNNRPPQSSAGDESQTDGPTNPLPDDPKLLALHREFIQKAERLAKEYQRDDEHDKALAVYGQILLLAPDYPPALEGIAQIAKAEATANRAVVNVLANRGWQDSGVDLIEGKPVRIAAHGRWTFRIAHELGPDGIPIPKELRDFNLGALVGIVVRADGKQSQPFLIGSRYEMSADAPGRLLLRMYDSDPSDNVGRLQVEITGRFQ